MKKAKASAKTADLARFGPFKEGDLLVALTAGPASLKRLGMATLMHTSDVRKFMNVFMQQGLVEIAYKVGRTNVYALKKSAKCQATPPIKKAIPTRCDDFMVTIGSLVLCYCTNPEQALEAMSEAPAGSDIALWKRVRTSERKVFSVREGV